MTTRALSLKAGYRRLEALGIELLPQRVDVAYGKPAARLIGITAIDRQADLDVIPPQHGGLGVLRN
jgi:hypothetical protein